MQTPWQVYEQAIASLNYEADPAQAEAMRALDDLFHQLQKSFCFVPKWLKNQPCPKGIYLYGEVGAGKTWMMDLFYQCVTIKKLRFHFYQFMRDIHSQLSSLQGHKEPLKIIAKQLRTRARLICFDELFVNDITDAMLLGRLFQFMFDAGICLVITANRPPDDLYHNGLQRSRFYPAIALLKKNLRQIQVKSLKDYRWKAALSEGVYFYPCNEATAAQLKKVFAALTDAELVFYAEPLDVNGREIDCLAYSADVLWVDFATLCHTPRSAQDYVALSKKFKIFIVDQIPVIDAEDDNSIWYLISLIDVLYDAKCRCVLRMEVRPADLYLGNKLKFEFQRTLSRLQEMQTQNYWS